MKRLACEETPAPDDCTLMEALRSNCTVVHRFSATSLFVSWPMFFPLPCSPNPGRRRQNTMPQPTRPTSLHLRTRSPAPARHIAAAAPISCIKVYVLETLHMKGCRY